MLAAGAMRRPDTAQGGPNMPIIARIALGLAALALPAPLAATLASDRDRPVATVLASVEGAAKLGPNVLPAPVGHRQPRAADLPAVIPKHPSDAWIERLNRELDRKLKICSNC
jgi:hypothetical protein